MKDDKSPYDPPESDVVQNKGIPEGFNGSNLSSRKLFIAGCLSLITIVLDVVIYILSFVSGVTQGEAYKLEYLLCSLVAIGASVYLLIVLRNLLHLRFNFLLADKYIMLMILINIISIVFVFLSVSENQSVRQISATIYMIAICPIGIVVILFGTKLLKIPGQYPGLRFYAWSTIIAGACYAVVIFYFLGFFVGLLSSIPFALMMFTASAEVSRQDR